MKTALLITSILLGTSVFAQEVDSTGLEGDNLDLEAVLEVFKNSESPEDFEKNLNTESSKVNNLDLDEDGEVDYIRVVDAGDSTAHVLTLQVAINENESQDVATIELEETDDDVVEIQIVGDEELYGENFILLPESAGRGPVVVNVIMWRPVRFMWGPRYTPWVSPWRYRAYPGWYRPWKRRNWRSYRGRVLVYRGGCRRVYKRSFTHAHVHHYHRTHSASFHKKHHHKHAGKSTSGKVSGGNNGKTGASNAAKPAKPSGKPNAASQGVTTTNTQPAGAKEQAVPKQNTRSSATPNTSKVTTTRQSTKTKSKKQAAPKPNATQKSNSTKARKRPGTSGGKQGRSSAGRKSGGGKRKN